MNSVVPAPIARQPWGMLIPLFMLVGFGAMVLFSAAGGNWKPFAIPHLVRFAVFLAMAGVMTLFSRDLVRLLAYPGYALVLAMLVAVEAMGFVGGGSQRWLDLGVIQLQPSELMKPAIVLVLARFYSGLPPSMTTSWRALVPAGVLIALPMGLVLLQPDLGTTLAIAFGGVVVMFLAGLPLRWFAAGAIGAMIVAPIAYFFGLHDYQRRRVTTFLDPESDPLGAGYHITQSKIAIGSGGLTGKGFNEGSQSHLNYLPEPHTDFVFATMAEEWGLLGGLAVILIFGLILRWGLQVAHRSQDRFAKLLAAGMVATIFFYVAINLMMVMGLAPVVGIPLPFMSHGGSSMLTNMICIGSLMMVNRWNRQAPQSRFR
ncbi:rod shape-determining protein RodA [Pelagerythrobacter marinus]|uniref:Peptidoglycan glycosyltransferase MrdB n=1 Tax=Pelagerythrobacter marinus TaxID=538382 RepID=A0ABW9UWK0_9SPHN|nr:rod shape-determining protein RodA [Pelagerythrobacter marinus]MEC9066429.1 rod shape-determining protein RodA [Pseudomonadota bacterium]MXO68294.1 rod shape-determining protein RodA [Pelagerythrobacter marinus]USA40547.1 rod shape-determining protein RodA [Pelagerythrobacter marinus]WPZ08282.1 rod shape-determining protein RodA [Pelagerythrobacter marinus]